MIKGKRSARLVTKPIKQLPDDIIVEILSRLPVKALIQFKTVCSQWKSLISHNIFSLCNDGRCREKPLFFFKRPERRSKRYVHEEKSSTNYWSLNSDLQIEEFENPFSDYEFFGSCNGLLLLGHGNDIYLWNPSVRFFKSVHHLSSLGHGGYNRMLASGFCYDDSVGDYKVVIIISQLRKSERTIYAFVSHLKSITWTKAKCPYEIVRTDWVAPLVGGNLHLLAQEKGKQFMVSFDMKRDEFKLFQESPDPKKSNNLVVLGMGVLEGRLCIVRLEKDDQLNWNTKDVLIMKDYGVKESWTTMFSIAFSVPIGPQYSLVPVFLTNNRGVVMLEENRRILAYSQESRKFVFSKSWVKPLMFGFTYVESVADGNQARTARKKRSNKLGDFVYSKVETVADGDQAKPARKKRSSKSGDVICLL